MRLADERVDPTNERKALEKARKLAAPLVRKVVTKKFPPKDMAVLEKYKKAYRDDCIMVVCTKTGRTRPLKFDFKPDTGPVVAGKTWKLPPYDAPPETFLAVEEFSAQREKYDEAKKALLNDYRALVYSARSLEAVVEVWPEAEELRPLRPALPALSEDAITRIKTDAQLRTKAAA